MVVPSQKTKNVQSLRILTKMPIKRMCEALQRGLIRSLLLLRARYTAQLCRSDVMQHLDMLVPLILLPFTLTIIYGAIWPEVIRGSKGRWSEQQQQCHAHNGIGTAQHWPKK